MRDKHGRKWHEHTDNKGNRYPAYFNSDGSEIVRTDTPLGIDESIADYISAESSDDRSKDV